MVRGTFLLLFGLTVTFVVEARPRYLRDFNKNYEDIGDLSALKGFKCGICHVNPKGRGTRNDYGQDLAVVGRNFEEIEAIDSDNDGVVNIAEIVAGTNPGDPTSF